jgi:hypothetical protein
MSVDLIVKEELDKDGNVIATKYQEVEVSITDVHAPPATDNPIIDVISANAFRGIVGEPVPDENGKTPTFEEKAQAWLKSMEWVVGML